jgi:tRNA (mo5U34)-methyltransferase
LQEAIKALEPWYHRVTVIDGVETPAKAANISGKLGILLPYLPKDLSGVRILDLGCNAGGLSIELARRGADCVGLESNKHYFAQAEWLAETTGLGSRLRFLNASVYRAASLGETFDVVLFMGLIYHLRYPQLAIDICRSLCRGTMFMNSPVVVSDAPVMENRLPRGPLAGRPAPYDDHTAHGWWYPSRAALETMMVAAGFERHKVIWSKETPFVSSGPQVDNQSAFPTGQVCYCAWAESPPMQTIPMLIRDLVGE